MKHNIRIREALEANGLFLYELGDLLGKSEPTITRMMRKELPEEEQERIISMIKGGKN